MWQGCLSSLNGYWQNWQGAAPRRHIEQVSISGKSMSAAACHCSSCASSARVLSAAAVACPVLPVPVSLPLVVLMLSFIFSSNWCWRSNQLITLLPGCSLGWHTLLYSSTPCCLQVLQHWDHATQDSSYRNGCGLSLCFLFPYLGL